MTYASVWPYFGWMTVFILVSAGLAKTVAPQVLRQTRKPLNFLPSLEGLRGLLACSVFFHHALFTYFYLSTGKWALESSFYLHLGHGAVLCFFFITGFLFWGRLLKGTPLVAKDFLWSRALRLGPAHLGAVYLIVLVIAFRTQWEMHEPILRVLGEIAQWMTFGVFKPLPSINQFAETRLVNAGVVWSLRFEWYFYLILPFLTWFAPVRRFVLLVGACLAVLVTAWLVRPEPILDVLWRSSEIPVIYSHSINAAVNWLLPILHFFVAGFVPGMIAAYVKRKLGTPTWIQNPLVSVAVVLLVSAHFFWFSPGYDLSAVPLLWSAFMLIALGCDLFGLLRTTGVQFLGSVSYSWYLIHGIVLFVLSRWVNAAHPFGQLTPLQHWLFVGATGILVLLASTVSFLALEQPFLHRIRPAPTMLKPGV